MPGLARLARALQKEDVNTLVWALRCVMLSGVLLGLAAGLLLTFVVTWYSQPPAVTERQREYEVECLAGKLWACVDRVMDTHSPRVHRPR